jgi:hypothetical protein
MFAARTLGGRWSYPGVDCPSSSVVGIESRTCKKNNSFTNFLRIWFEGGVPCGSLPVF